MGRAISRTSCLAAQVFILLPPVCSSNHQSNHRSNGTERCSLSLFQSALRYAFSSASAGDRSNFFALSSVPSRLSCWLVRELFNSAFPRASRSCESVPSQSISNSPLVNHPFAPGQRRSLSSRRPQQAKNWPGFVGFTFTAMLIPHPPRKPTALRSRRNPPPVAAIPGKPAPSDRTSVGAVRTVGEFQSLRDLCLALSAQGR